MRAKLTKVSHSRMLLPLTTFDSDFFPEKKYFFDSEIPIYLAFKSRYI